MQLHLFAEFRKQQARRAHHRREHARPEQIAQRFRNAQPRFRKGRRPLADRLFRTARAEHEQDKKPQHARAQKGAQFYRFLPLLHQRIDGHEQEIDCVQKRDCRPREGENAPIFDAGAYKKQGGQRDDGDLPPTVKGMEQAHDRFFPFEGGMPPRWG